MERLIPETFTTTRCLTTSRSASLAQKVYNWIAVTNKTAPTTTKIRPDSDEKSIELLFTLPLISDKSLIRQHFQRACHESLTHRRPERHTRRSNHQRDQSPSWFRDSALRHPTLSTLTTQPTLKRKEDLAKTCHNWPKQPSDDIQSHNSFVVIDQIRHDLSSQRRTDNKQPDLGPYTKPKRQISCTAQGCQRESIVVETISIPLNRTAWQEHIESPADGLPSTDLGYDSVKLLRHTLQARLLLRPHQTHERKSE